MLCRLIRKMSTKSLNALFFSCKWAMLCLSILSLLRKNSFKHNTHPLEFSSATNAKNSGDCVGRSSLLSEKPPSRYKSIFKFNTKSMTKDFFMRYSFFSWLPSRFSCGPFGIFSKSANSYSIPKRRSRINEEENGRYQKLLLFNR